jgi:hypothetical protein
LGKEDGLCITGLLDGRCPKCSRTRDHASVRLDGDQLSSAIFDDLWFDKYLLPPDSRLKRIEIGEIIYILSDKADENSQLLIVNVGPDGVLGYDVSPRHLFERIMHVGRVNFEH